MGGGKRYMIHARSKSIETYLEITFPPDSTTEQEFATLTQGLVQNHSDAIIQQLKAMSVQSCKSTSDSGSVKAYLVLYRDQLPVRKK
jgi:hypothetical protein